MDRLLAAVAFIAFAGFVGILALEVPHPDLWAVIGITLALVATDLVLAARNRRD
ncbi:hypothetical protein [Rhodovulum sulfidophilum]|uniref:Uncharacterized protein n=1 Tax=Rhodovulum sulfidophilum TaxID=35806 RepID=A0ABS1RS11_RHOSU|nr:hypothetical protein [Rhodovulum sulfidophilum]MBL3553920.1 hypothetical protein [Rhodovulum sulfidophilum]MBL3566827.1 hypothetical protein [Rhodovulum sulfidophilum]MBL3608852.1 hypothetical protein [Rhodovulum sulfidophilum]MCE8420166.1 hypothetical protein [Rhodovulum sulfidophilum]MCE8439439.1 hypothetical protein [Rhodovulum sulfidophilum]